MSGRGIALLAAALACGVAHAQSPKSSLSFSSTAEAVAYNVSPEQSTGQDKIKANVVGDERLICSNDPADKSLSTATASGAINRKDDPTIDVDLTAYASARGGKYASCKKCDAQRQFCLEPGQDVQTKAEATASITATVLYSFPQMMNGPTLYRLRVRVLSLSGSSPGGGALAFSVTRDNSEQRINPNESQVLTIKPGEDIFVTATLTAVQRGAQSDQFLKSEPKAKVRIELAEAPILDAAVLQGYILNGTLTSTFPAIGLLALDDDGQLKAHCTGSVVGNHSILTAAHCVGRPALQKAVQDHHMLFLPADNIKSRITPVMITAFEIPSGDPPERFRFNERVDRSLEDDVAVLHTDTPIGVTALKLHESSLQDGQQLKFVGFGLNPSPTTESREGGVKREATSPIENVDNRTFMVSVAQGGKSTCLGDSGGPALIDEGGTYTIAGITSYGAANCSSGRSMRADFYRSWIEKKIN